MNEHIVHVCIYAVRSVRPFAA